MKRSILVPLLLCSFLAAAAPVRFARADDATTQAEARAHFSRGVEFYKEGDYRTALIEFKRAYEVLPNYKVLYNCDTVRKIVSRFAPPNENPTDNYLETVAHGVGVKPDDKIDVSNPNTMFALVKAMTKFETGSWEPYWTDRQLSDGMFLAGCERPQVMT